MKEINFTVGKAREIKINGEVYPVYMSDADIFEEMNALYRKYSEYAKDNKEGAQIEQALESAGGMKRGISAFIDKMIGKGKAKALFNVKVPVGIAERMDVAMAIGAGIINMYNDEIDKEYSLDDDKE